MVDLSGSGDRYSHSIDNTIFIAPAIIILLFVGLCTYKLVQSLRDKRVKQEEKRKIKMEKKGKSKLK